MPQPKTSPFCTRLRARTNGLPQASTQQIGCWLDQVAHGNREAYAEVLSHLGERLCAVASRQRYRLTPDARRRLETEDMLQDLTVRLLSRCESLADRLKVVPPAERVRFFFGCTAQILRDLISEQARRRRPREVQFAAGGAETDDSAGLSLDALAIHESESPEQLAMWADFHNFVSGLPDGLREVVDLHWFHGLTHVEVGELLGIAEVTSRARWARARHQAMQRFSESPFEWSAAMLVPAWWRSPRPACAGSPSSDSQTRAKL